ncbi:MAG: hypothetical protein QNJ63_09575 [Calothrix sp. MO_192.B10]|nr:hypothetical protein [Calothrix sp. MO_192.B10]
MPEPEINGGNGDQENKDLIPLEHLTEDIWVTKNPETDEDEFYDEESLEEEFGIPPASSNGRNGKDENQDSSESQ